MRRALGVIVVAAALSLGTLAQRLRYGAVAHSPSAPSSSGAPASPAGRDSLPFSLTESAAAAGLVHGHERLDIHPSVSNVAPYVSAAAGAGAAVADFDGDGWPDVYLTSAKRGSRNHLYRNNHDGTFSDVSDAAGVGDINREAGTLRALFFDYDDDGRPDLLLTTAWCPRLFHNEGGGRFKEVTAESGLDHCGAAVAANVVDYDNDGFLDLVIADFWPHVNLYHPDTMAFMPNSWVAADNGGPITVYHNEGGRRFSRVPGALGIKSRGWTQAVGVYDLRGTGRLDLYFATDFGLDQVYFNQGGGRFTDGSEALRETFGKHGMNAEIADLDNDGAPVIYVTHIYEPGRIMDRNMMRKFARGRFDSLAGPRGVDHCGWSWGAKFLDLDNDGRLDLVVSNGMLSQNPRKDQWYNMQLVSMASSGVMVDARAWRPMKDSSLAGYEQKCLFHNTGRGFKDVTEATALASDRTDGRALAAIDVLNDGSMSFVEAVVGGKARFYRNRQNNRNGWIGFSLAGTRSNRDAHGARVTVRLTDGRTMTAQQVSANGFEAQSDPRLHFGLGPGAAVASAMIRWPSGATQTLFSPAAGRYHRVEEPR